MVILIFMNKFEKKNIYILIREYNLYTITYFFHYKDICLDLYAMNSLYIRYSLMSTKKFILDIETCNLEVTYEFKRASSILS